MQVELLLSLDGEHVRRAQVLQQDAPTGVYTMTETAFGMPLSLSVGTPTKEAISLELARLARDYPDLYVAAARLLPSEHLQTMAMLPQMDDWESLKAAMKAAARAQQIKGMTPGMTTSTSSTVNTVAINSMDVRVPLPSEATSARIMSPHGTVIADIPAGPKRAAKTSPAAKAPQTRRSVSKSATNGRAGASGRSKTRAAASPSARS